MKNFKAILLGFSAVYLLSGCPGKVKATFQSTAPPSTLANSKISLVNDGAMADGTSAVVVMVNFIDNEENPKEGLTPEYEISGDGVTSQPCTTSNSGGLSICMLKATVEGVKTFKVTNVEGLDLKSDITFSKFEPQKPGFSTGGGSTTVSTGIKQITVSNQVEYETTKDANGDSIVKCRQNGDPNASKVSCFNSDGSVNTGAIVYAKDNSNNLIPIYETNPDGSLKLDGNSQPIPTTAIVSTGDATVALKAISSFGEPLSLVEQKMVAESDLCTSADVSGSAHGCTAVGNARSGATILGKARANMQGVLNE